MPEISSVQQQQAALKAVTKKLKLAEISRAKQSADSVDDEVPDNCAVRAFY